MSEKITVISELEEKEETVEEQLTDDNLSKSIVDLSLSLKTRIKAIDMYFVKEGADNTIETVNKLAIMYEMSGTKNLRQYLFSICEKSKIDPFLQSIAAKALFVFDKKDDLAYEGMTLVYPKLKAQNIGTPYRIDFLKALMNGGEKYKERTKDYFCEIIDDTSLNSTYRYKTILSLNQEEEDKKLLYFCKEACLVFLNNEKNDIRLRILSGQFLLQKCEEFNRLEVENKILTMAEDKNLEYNLRADATDVLLQLGIETKKKAESIILELGVGLDRKVFNIYENKQNVHTKEVEESVKQALEFLQLFDLLKHEGKPIDLDFVERNVLKMVDNSEQIEKIKISFNRISMDRALYSVYNCTLTQILLKIWTYLTGHKSEEEIKNRLVEELIEMAGTCSSGFASRLVNTISGFGDFSIRISWQDQIISNLNGRLNALIRDMDNLTLQEKILEEAIIPSSDYELRKNFLKFFRNNLSSIREEMYSEFKNHIQDTDYDLYFRTAVSMYEQGTA